MYQGTPSSALVLAALRAAPRPSRPAAIKPGPKWNAGWRPARQTRRPQISNDQDQLQDETATFWIAIGEGSPISGAVPASIVNDRSNAASWNRAAANAATMALLTAAS